MSQAAFSPRSGCEQSLKHRGHQDPRPHRPGLRALLKILRAGELTRVPFRWEMRFLQRHSAYAVQRELARLEAGYAPQTHHRAHEGADLCRRAQMPEA
jgi:hypothetical protein